MSKSKILRALSLLAQAAGGAETDQAGDVMAVAAGDARAEYDAMCAENERLRAALEKADEALRQAFVLLEAASEDNPEWATDHGEPLILANEVMNEARLSAQPFITKA